MDTDETNKMVFIDSKRASGKILLRGGYRYNFDKKNKGGSTNWRCCNRSVCSTSITLNKDDKVIRESKHMCKPEFMKREVEGHVNDLKRKVCGSMEPVPKIFEQSVQDFVENCDGEFDFTLIPEWKKLKTTLYNARNKSLGVEKCTFQHFSEVVIPLKLSDDFLICNDGDVDKILIFASPSAVDILAKCTEYFGDGTFKAAPPPFLQIYTMQVNLTNNADSSCFVPVVYALLPNKEENTYKRLFSLLKHEFSQEIAKFKCDFEIAAINGLKAVHQDVVVTGCYFHYQKALWKKSKELGLIDDEEGRIYTKICTRLALLPKEDIPAAYLEISESIPDRSVITPFHNYFLNFWMRKITGSMFSVSEEEFRTNNAVEGWNNRLNHRIPAKPSLFRFIELLRVEAQHQDIKIRKMQLHCPSVIKSRRAKDVQKYHQEREIVNDFIDKKITVIECLNRLCLVI